MAFLNFRSGFLLLSVMITMLASGCRRNTRLLVSPPHYNFSEVFTDKLDLKLQEISGLAWDSKANLFYAVNDELGKLYTLDKETKAIIGEFVFGGRGDYEEVALYNGEPYVLRSDGMIIKVIIDSSKATGKEEGKIPLAGSNDFETMYHDPTRNALVLICKNCASDDEKTVSAFAYYPDSIGFDSKPLYVIDAAKVAALSPFKTSKFQPSAAAIHPKLQKLFIISSASNQLVVADLNGKVESVHKLSPKLFLQPEGIAFKQSGDMYISNEGLGAKATFLRFKFIAVTEKAKMEIDKSGYNFSEPDDKMELNKHLKEISGMAFIPATGMILAENDEKGDIFTVDFANKQDLVGKVKFGGKDDYEDIVYTDTAIYILVSPGKIVQVSLKDSSFATKEFDLGLKGTNEFEAMYLDKGGKALILLCKDCAKEKNEIRNAYRFDLATQQFSAEPHYTIDIKSIQEKLNDDKAEFKPSAAGIHPINNKLYIVASVGKILVIADKNGVVEEVIRLDPVLYNQPEGLTFAPNGDLYISNEAGETIATILKFKYNQ